jgi:cation transport ATPase
VSDECCAGESPTPQQTGGPQQTEDYSPLRPWQVEGLRFAALAGLLLATGYASGWLGAPEWAVTTLKVAALAVAGWTFAPSAVARLLRGRIGIGTLMTLAAGGAVLLGELGEAAMLAFLYSIAEGLEDYALARTRRGLRALLDHSLIRRSAPVESTATCCRKRTAVRSFIPALSVQHHCKPVSRWDREERGGGTRPNHGCSSESA